MIEQKLLNTLVRRNIVTNGTEIEVDYLVPGLDSCSRHKVTGVFSIKRLIIKDNNVTQIICLRTTDGAELRTNHEHIIKIDGMLPTELASVFNIKSDGSEKIIKLDEFGNPIKRGRKPNKLKEKMLNDGNNRSKELSNDKIEESVKGKRRRNSKVEETAAGCKL